MRCERLLRHTWHPLKGVPHKNADPRPEICSSRVDLGDKWAVSSGVALQLLQLPLLLLLLPLLFLILLLIQLLLLLLWYHDDFHCRKLLRDVFGCRWVRIIKLEPPSR